MRLYMRRVLDIKRILALLIFKVFVNRYIRFGLIFYPPYFDRKYGPVHCVFTSTTETPLGNNQRQSLTTEMANLVHGEIVRVPFPRAY
jgi:hypothetical protein